MGIILKYQSLGNNTCKIYGYEYEGQVDAKETLILPSIGPTGEKLVAIGDFAFCGCTSLASIEIPAGVTSIGEYAFFFCTSLTSVTFEENSQLMGIKAFAFYGCWLLTSIWIPTGVVSIGREAFRGCKNLKSVEYNYKAFALDSKGEIFAKADPTVKFRINRKRKCKDKNLQICKSGIHYCENIFDIFNYYHGKYGEDFVITICDVSKNNIGHQVDSKRCAEWVIPRKVLTREEVIKIMNGEDIK